MAILEEETDSGPQNETKPKSYNDMNEAEREKHDKEQKARETAEQEGKP